MDEKCHIADVDHAYQNMISFHHKAWWVLHPQNYRDSFWKCDI